MGGVLLQAGFETSPPGGYGWMLLQTLFALVGVCVLAWALLRWGARRGLGVGAGGRVRVLERQPLDGRRALYLVEVGGRVLLLGAGDGASPTLLAELSSDELPARDGVAPSTPFAEVLRKLRAG